MNRVDSFNLSAPPPHAKRHTSILNYFTNYMRNNLCAGASNLNFLSNEAASLTMAVRLTCWKSYKWVRYTVLIILYSKIQANKQGMGLLLNNDTLQVNFIEDSVKIIIHGPFVPGSAVLILIDSTRTLQVKLLQN